MESGTHIDKGDLNRFIIENDGAGCLPASLSSLFSEGKIIKLTVDMDKLRILTELGLGHGAIKTTLPNFLDLSLGIELQLGKLDGRLIIFMSFLHLNENRKQLSIQTKVPINYR